MFNTFLYKIVKSETVRQVDKEVYQSRQFKTGIRKTHIK